MFSLFGKLKTWGLAILAGLVAVLGIMAASARAGKADAQRRLAERNQKAAEARQQQQQAAYDEAADAREAGDELIREVQDNAKPSDRNQLDNDGRV